MIRKALLLRIFSAAYMQRWNDKVRPVELVELDKQAHKMIIAYFLGKFDEKTKGFDWIEVIEGGLFELLQRLVVTDLKPPIFYKIKSDKAQYKKLNDWVFKEIEPVISPIGKDFSARFRDYFSVSAENVNRRVLSAAHYFATKWEFDIVERANPDGYEISSIKQALTRKQEEYSDVKGMLRLKEHAPYRNFLDLCGQLRFQTRWSNLHRIPKTSVIGHSLFVALLSFLFSIQIGACRRRRINNYFTGLFHDLPEVLTRDIISPVKKSVEGLDELIKEYEREQMNKEVYGLIPRALHPEIKLFTEDEFDDVVHLNGRRKKVSSEDINEKYNNDRFNPRDGQLVKATDSLAAFIEAYAAIRNGSYSQEFQEAKVAFRDMYGKANVAGINLGEIYADFE
ncbi:MAG: HD domain-containing protein [Dissulfurispiraceae bacterium]